MGGSVTTPSTTTTTTGPSKIPPWYRLTTASRPTEPPFDWTKEWNFYFFDLDRPGATILIGAISIVHSLFHLPHCLLYRRLGILTAFWSLIGVGLVFGAVVENEMLYDAWIWYSCVYVPVMLVTMTMVLTAAIWALDLKLLRAICATLAILFYLFMFYCIIFVNAEKRKIFTTTTTSVMWNTTECATCGECTTQKCTPPTAAAPKKMLKRTGLLRYLDYRF